MQVDPAIFKNYDIRAIIPDQLDKEGMYQLGLGIARYFQPQTIAIGRDARLSSDLFFQQLTQAFTRSGINIIDLGLITTDMSYFASGKYGYDLTLMITASHNPTEYNGLKLTKKNAVAVSGESGIYDLRDLVLTQSLTPLKTSKRGRVTPKNIWYDWIQHALSFVDLSKIKPFKILFDAGNGVAAVSLKKFAPHLPLHIDYLYDKPDGHFPNHLPYPLQEEFIKEIKQQVSQKGYDLGIAADGDGDRMFFIDEKGQFVSGSTITAVVAEFLLKKYGPDKIIYNAIVGREVPEIVKQYGGTPIRWRVGHSLLKEKMLAENALFAGEHSGHFFFRDNYHADSGIILVLLVLQALSESNQPMSVFLQKYRKYQTSGEINFRTDKKQATMKALEQKYQTEAQSIDWLDGITVWFKDWWFNVRASNTQPLLRLNVEVNNPQTISLKQKISELTTFIEKMGGKKVIE